MIEINTIQAISWFLIGLGVFSHLLSLYEAQKSSRSLRHLSTGTQRMASGADPSKSMTPKQEAEINASFEELAATNQAIEHEPDYELPIDNISPGDLVKTVKIPPFVQRHNKRPQQNHCKA